MPRPKGGGGVNYYSPARRSRAKASELGCEIHAVTQRRRDQDGPEARMIRFEGELVARALRLVTTLRTTRDPDRTVVVDALAKVLRKTAEVSLWHLRFDQRENHDHLDLDGTARSLCAALEGVEVAQDDGPDWAGLTDGSTALSDAGMRYHGYPE